MQVVSPAASVAKTTDHRLALGYPVPVADHWDWIRRASELDGDSDGGERWCAWFDERLSDDPDHRLIELREWDVDRMSGTYVEPETVDERTARGVRRLVEVVGPDRVLDALADDRIREYVAAQDGRATE